MTRSRCFYGIQAFDAKSALRADASYKKEGGKLPPHPSLICHDLSRSATPPQAEVPFLGAGHLHVNAAGVGHRRIDCNSIHFRGSQRHGIQCKARR
jgi:hypothetical protein